MADPVERPVPGPATGAALKSALKGALAEKGDGLYQKTGTPPPAAEPPPNSSAGPGGLAREKTIMETVAGTQKGDHVVGDENAPSNAGKTAQSSDHWNSY